MYIQHLACLLYSLLLLACFTDFVFVFFFCFHFTSTSTSSSSPFDRQTDGRTMIYLVHDMGFSKPELHPWLIKIPSFS